MTKQQPMKMAAAEALYTTRSGAPFSLFAVAPFEHTPTRSTFDITIPHGLSILATNSWNGKVEGINDLNRKYGGERQRLALARALLADVRLLVLEEPDAHLDDETAEALVRELLGASRAEGIGVLLITHRTVDPAIVDGIVELRDGGESCLPKGARRGRRACAAISRSSRAHMTKARVVCARDPGPISLVAHELIARGVDRDPEVSKPFGGPARVRRLECSPTPPVNTSTSSPPSDAASPRSRRRRNT